MLVSISPRSSEPIYQQLYDQISAQIIRGELQADAPLPPIRTLAKELRISVITVKKAYELLEREGLIYTVVGRGTFVEELSSADRSDRRTEELVRRLREDVAHYKRMGLALDEIIRWVRIVFEEVES